MDCHFRDLPLFCHYSCLGTLEIGQIPKMTVHKKLLMKWKVLNQIDDLGVIIMKKRCSIQQGEKDNCWSEQSPEKSTVSTVPFFCGPPGIYIYFSFGFLIFHAFS